MNLSCFYYLLIRSKTPYVHFSVFSDSKRTAFATFDLSDFQFGQRFDFGQFCDRLCRCIGNTETTTICTTNGKAFVIICENNRMMLSTYSREKETI